MSEVKGISTITNRAGTGAVDFSNGVNISGSDSGLSGFKHTEGSTEPTSPSNGDTWWDTENEVYQIYVNDTWTTYIGASSSAVWYGSRGLFIGGYRGSGASNIIDYLNIASTGNATSGATLSVARYDLGSASDGTTAINFGGNDGSNKSNVIDYFTISDTSTAAADFGDLSAANQHISGFSDGTYGVFGTGYNTSYANDIEYVTISTTGNASDFGDATVARQGTGSANDATYGLFSGGQSSGGYQNVIDYVTIQPLPTLQILVI